MNYSQIAVDKLETLPDGTIIVSVGGIEYRGLPAPKIKEILKEREELKILRLDYASLQLQIADVRKTSEALRLEDAKILDLEKKKRDVQISFWSGEYNRELKLREKFQKEIEKCRKFIIWRIC